MTSRHPESHATGSRAFAGPDTGRNWRLGALAVAAAAALLSAGPASGQSAPVCTPVVASGTYNGVAVTVTTTNTATYGGAWTSCGITTPASAIWGGSAGAFSVTFGFSIPQASARMQISAADGGESFTFTPNTGTASLSSTASSCPPVLSGAIATFPGSDDGADLTINGSTPFTSLSVAGPGGHSGSLFVLCAEALNATPPSQSVPTLGAWGLMLLGLIAAGLGGRRLRPQRRV